MLSDTQRNLCRQIQQASSACGMPVYLVGGVVRDWLIGLESLEKDLDFIIEGDAPEFATHLVKLIGGMLKSFPDFLTAKIVSPEGVSGIDEVDFATARTEVYLKPGKLPTVTAALIQEDLGRRDFSINAMALPLEHAITNSDIQDAVIDPFNGRADLKARLVRVLHNQSFVDDPTRIFRALRYAGRLNGSLDSGTETLLTDAIEAGVLQTISLMRRFTEIVKIMNERNAFTILSLLKAHAIDRRFDPSRVDGTLFLKSLVDCAHFPWRDSRVQSRLIRPVVEMLLVYATTPESEDSIFQALALSKARRGEIQEDLSMIRTQKVPKGDASIVIAAALHPQHEAYVVCANERGLRGTDPL